MEVVFVRICKFTQISELLKALDEMKSPPCDTTTHIDPCNIRATLSILKNTGTDASNTHRTFRSRAVLPENISLLSKCEFKRRDHLSETLPAPVPVPAPATAVSQSQEGQLQSTLASLNPVIAHLVAKSKMSATDLPVEKQPKKQDVYPQVLDVMAWTKQPSCEPRWIPAKPPQQTGQRIWVKGIVLVVSGLKITL